MVNLGLTSTTTTTTTTRTSSDSKGCLMPITAFVMKSQERKKVINPSIRNSVTVLHYCDISYHNAREA